MYFLEFKDLLQYQKYALHLLVQRIHVFPLFRFVLTVSAQLVKLARTTVNSVLNLLTDLVPYDGIRALY